MSYAEQVKFCLVQGCSKTSPCTALRQAHLPFLILLLRELFRDFRELFFSEINSLYFKIQSHVLYTKTDTKGDLVFSSGFKQDCAFQDCLTRHSDFKEAIQLHDSRPMLKIVLQALQESFCQCPLTRESKKFQRFPGVKKKTKKRDRNKEKAKMVSLQCHIKQGQFSTNVLPCAFLLPGSSHHFQQLSSCHSTNCLLIPPLSTFTLY